MSTTDARTRRTFPVTDWQSVDHAAGHAYGDPYRILLALSFDLDELREEVWFTSLAFDPDGSTVELYRPDAAEPVAVLRMSDRHADARLMVGDR